MAFIKKTSIFCLFAILAGCSENSTPAKTEASAPSAETVETNEVRSASTSDGATRIVIYRTSIAGLAIQPKVFVDGRPAAACSPGRSMTVNVTPGTHSISATTLTEKSLSVEVAPGATTYVKCSIGFGLIAGRAKFTQVPTSEGAAKSAKLKTQGTF